MISATKRTGCIPGLALIMGIVICIFACNSKPVGLQKTDSFVKKKDSVYVAIAFLPKKIVFTGEVGYETFINAQLKDSLKAGDSMVRVKSYVDTAFFVRTTDTLKDQTGKPILDSLHRIKFRVQQVDKRFVQIINIPR